MAGLVGRVLVTGAAAALASAFTTLVWIRIDRGRATPSLNAVSHIAWGGEPPAEAGPKGINFATGVALHAGASLFWATSLELAFGRIARRSRAAAWLGGAIVSAVAFVTDYYLVSRRFQTRLRGLSVAPRPARRVRCDRRGAGARRALYPA